MFNSEVDETLKTDMYNQFALTYITAQCYINVPDKGQLVSV